MHSLPQKHQTKSCNICIGPSAEPCRSCLLLCEPIWALLRWFCRSCSPNVRHPLWLLQSFLLLFYRVPEVQGDVPDDFLQFRLSLHNVCLWVYAPAPICCRRKSLIRYHFNDLHYHFFCQLCFILHLVSRIAIFCSCPFIWCRGWASSHYLELKISTY